MNIWDESAAAYDRFEKRWRHYSHVAEGLVSSLEIKENSRILELACGTGACTVLLSKLCARGEVLAMDSSVEMVDFARNNLKEAGNSNVRFLLGNANNLLNLLGSWRFDIASCNAAFWQFQHKQIVLKQIYNLLVPGGQFGFNVPEWFPSEKAHDEFLCAASEILKKHGLGPEKLHESKLSSTLFADVASYESLLEEAGFKVEVCKDYTFEFSEQSMKDWRKIPAFEEANQPESENEGERQGQLAKEELRREFARLQQDDNMSRWKILVGRK